MSDKQGHCLNTLSKKGLYAPLSVYSNGSSSGLAKNKTPQSLKDGALVEFLFNVGQNYNWEGSLSDGKNNGCMPASHNEVGDRIKQRSLTLVGGGINTSIAKPRKRTQVSSARSKYAFNNKKRKQDAQGARDADGHNGNWNTLKEINLKWTIYARKCLLDDGFDDKSPKKCSSRTAVSGLAAKVEAIGAFVTVQTLHSLHPLVTIRGYLIGETSSTWTIARLDGQPKQDHDKMACIIKHIPKEGRKLVLHLPLLSE